MMIIFEFTYPYLKYDLFLQNVRNTRILSTTYAIQLVLFLFVPLRLHEGKHVRTICLFICT